MATEYVDYGDNEIPIDFKKVEERKNAKYVGNFAIKDSRGNWSESPVQIYWQEKPPIEGYSNYFGIFIRGGDVYITSGGSLEGVIFQGIRCDEKILYSRYRWDNRGALNSRGEHCAIDGGRDYTKITGYPDEHVALQLQGPNMVVIER